MRRFILLLCMATATLAAQGQVLKCTHPKTGAVTFSDVPCETGQNGESCTGSGTHWICN